MKQSFSYRTRGTCSSMIQFTIEDGILHDVKYTGGCSGNLQGISRLTEGMPVGDVIARLSGIRCGFKPTSCPDQLTIALKEALKQIAQNGKENS